MELVIIFYVMQKPKHTCITIIYILTNAECWQSNCVNSFNPPFQLLLLISEFSTNISPSHLSLVTWWPPPYLAPRCYATIRPVSCSPVRCASVQIVQCSDLVTNEMISEKMILLAITVLFLLVRINAQVRCRYKFCRHQTYINNQTVFAFKPYLRLCRKLVLINHAGRVGR